MFEADALLQLCERMAALEQLHALELCRLKRPGHFGYIPQVPDGELQAVASAVGVAFLIGLAELRQETRRQPVALARQVAFWLQRELTGADGERIGMWWGGKHRTTVNYGIHQITLRLRGGDEHLQKVVRGVAAAFKGNETA